jgi:hypothetical protein
MGAVAAHQFTVDISTIHQVTDYPLAYASSDMMNRDQCHHPLFASRIDILVEQDWQRTSGYPSCKIQMQSFSYVYFKSTGA